ncbi:putative gustatory receptor 28a [Cardiocondyla obscurior]|uniref:putative gustatory receptor 28a n=1 Tax=Cardiocondyla obscurior TaxID=286306 RepID=UPI0039656BF1
MELQTVPFDVENIFAKVKKKQALSKLRGADSPLYKAVWPMTCVVRVFGFAPYSFSQDRLVPSSLIFTVIATIFYSYTLFQVVIRFIGVKRETSTLGGTENTKVIINYSVVLYELILVTFTRSSFVKIWNALQDYDDYVRRLGYPRKEMRTAIVAWVLVIVNTLIWTAINRFGMYAFMESWTYNMGYMLPYVGTSVAIYKFMAIAIFLGQRFHHLNMIAIKNLPFSPTVGKTFVSKQVRIILNLHNDLMIAGESLESLYSWSLLFWLGSLSLHTISNIYFIIEWMIVKEWKTESWPLIGCLCLWLVAFIVQMILLHIACDFASSQANCIGPIMIEWQVRLMKRFEVDEGSVELSLQFLNRKLKFSAGGCFYVNLPLLRSIASLMTTYLVILLQLQ